MTGFFRQWLVFTSIFLLKPISSPLGADFLFARAERMAVRANFDQHHLFVGGRSGQKRVPATTGYFDFFIIRMDTLFHNNLSLKNIPRKIGRLS